MVKLKLSLGSAISLGLMNGRLNVPFSTIYIMLGEECISNCLFCTQSRDAKKKKHLSRVTWYEFDLEKIINKIKEKNYSRICFQTLDYPDILYDLLKVLPFFYKLNIPISVSIAPPIQGNLKSISDYVDTISIALDAANDKLFEKIKGIERGNRFTWQDHWKCLIESRAFFKNVNTHLIVGLGESDKDLVNTMLRLKNLAISTALFSYTPVLGFGSKPTIERYRKIQLARCLIYNYNTEIDSFRFNENSELEKIESKNLERAISDPSCFITSGCLGCNRPFYNESPRNIYNFPYKPKDDDLLEIKNLLVKIK
ncbi:MAG: radical SAM protein [Thermoplasmata archaeon]